jgi:hypothetical protein
MKPCCLPSRCFGSEPVNGLAEAGICKPDIVGPLADIDRVLDLPRQFEGTAIIINDYQMIASMQVYISEDGFSKRMSFKVRCTIRRSL